MNFILKNYLLNLFLTFEIRENTIKVFNIRRSNSDESTRFKRTYYKRYISKMNYNKNKNIKYSKKVLIKKLKPNKTLYHFYNGIIVKVI